MQLRRRWGRLGLNYREIFFCVFSCWMTFVFAVNSHVELRQTLESVSKYCPLIENLFFESSKTGKFYPTCSFPTVLSKVPLLMLLFLCLGRDDSLKLPTCSDLVNNCPNLSSLSLRGFKLHDYKARVLVKVCILIISVQMDQSLLFSFSFMYLPFYK